MVKGDGKKRTNVILIVGFLGAGKTTLLKHILSYDKDMSDTVVIVNEFGEVGIDGSILKGMGEVVELTSGCICCTLALGVRKTLRDVIDNIAPEWIFIEASGVADPNNIIPIVGEFIEGGDVDSLKTVTVVESDLWGAREVLGALFYNQLRSADLIIFNKVDLIDEDGLKIAMEEIGEVAVDSMIVPAVEARVDMKIIKEGIRGGADFLHKGGDWEKTETTDFITFSFLEARPINEARFKEFLRSLPFGMFRIKGSIRFSDQTMFLSYVGGKVELSEMSDSTDVGEEMTRLSFVGWEVDKDDIIVRLKGCFD